MPTQPTPQVNYFDPDESDDGHTNVVESEPTPPKTGPIATRINPDLVAIVAGERRQRGDLELQVKAICDDLVTGVLEIEQAHTPYRLAAAIGEKYGDKAPSVGAVTAVLKRWEDIGFAVAAEKPYAFEAYTEDAATVGLAALRERHRAITKAERREARAAAKAEKAAAIAAKPIDPDDPF